jgi:hypothetical protein
MMIDTSDPAWSAISGVLIGMAIAGVDFGDDATLKIAIMMGRNRHESCCGEKMIREMTSRPGKTHEELSTDPSTWISVPTRR